MKFFLTVIFVFSVVVFTGCAVSPTRPNESSPGQQISNNLLKVHEIYCGGSREANARLVELKNSNPPYLVKDRNTGESSNVWIIVPPVTNRQTLVSWGMSLTEPIGGGSCGVAYLQPEQLEMLKSGYLP
jgi:hypothetical protein